ncbi:hypothetical protein [Ruegeria atlantica]|uniref:hypothetical protein n=1 Tax=Ruegeria atlantica TaxID=81569 RepID=UPI00147A2D76|nr:hypothetical protein [Ruegeria atlantica]
MTPAKFLDHAESVGFRFWMDGDKIRYSGPREPKPQGLEFIRENRAAFVRVLKGREKRKKQTQDLHNARYGPDLHTVLASWPCVRSAPSILRNAADLILSARWFPTFKGWVKGDPRPMFSEVMAEQHRGRILTLRRCVVSSDRAGVPDRLPMAWTTILSRLAIDLFNKRRLINEG